MRTGVACVADGTPLSLDPVRDRFLRVSRLVSSKHKVTVRILPSVIWTQLDHIESTAGFEYKIPVSIRQSP